MGWLGGDGDVPQRPSERGGAAGARLLPQGGRRCCAHRGASLSPELPPLLSPPAPSPFSVAEVSRGQGKCLCGGIPLRSLLLRMFSC